MASELSVQRRNGGLLLFACCVSLLIHAGLAWWLLRRPWAAPASALPLEIFLDDRSLRMVDLTQPANRIRPIKPTAVGVEHHATTEETVAVTRPIRPSRQGRDASFMKREAKTNDASRTTSDERPQSAMREPTTMRPRLPATALSEDLGRGLGGGYLPEDYFPDYQHGHHTYLNVLKRPGIDYFVELKRTFKTAWDPIPPLRAHALANEVNRGNVKVVLAVSVDRAGNLSELFVLKGSGLVRYDQEAVRTVRASAPFSSPPPDLLAADDTLRMSWTFIVYL